VGTDSYVSNSLSTFNHTYFEATFKENYVATPGGDFYPYVAYILIIDPEI
jgi:hypothetical protein